MFLIHCVVFEAEICVLGEGKQVEYIALLLNAFWITWRNLRLCEELVVAWDFFRVNMSTKVLLHQWISNCLQWNESVLCMKTPTEFHDCIMILFSPP